jgi:hypothetical protein
MLPTDEFECARHRRSEQAIASLSLDFGRLERTNRDVVRWLQIATAAVALCTAVAIAYGTVAPLYAQPRIAAAVDRQLRAQAGEVAKSRAVELQDVADRAAKAAVGMVLVPQDRIKASP